MQTTRGTPALGRAVCLSRMSPVRLLAPRPTTRFRPLQVGYGEHQAPQSVDAEARGLVMRLRTRGKVCNLRDGHQHQVWCKHSGDGCCS